jgi:hypothetical protein
VLEEMKQSLMVIGVLLLANGLLFMGQGSGYVPWPATSFMIDQTQWIYYGGAIALLGLLLVIIAARRSADRNR